MLTDIVAQELSSALGLLFVAENEQVVSDISIGNYHYRIELEELPPGDEMRVLQISVTPGYSKDIFFDFKAVVPRCKAELFDLQAALRVGRLELAPRGKTLTVSLRDKAALLLNEEENEGEDLAARFSEPTLSQLLNEAVEISVLLRAISLGNALTPNIISLVKESRANTNSSQFFN